MLGVLVSVMSFYVEIKSDGIFIDMNIYFESPPQDQSDRWSGRPFRAYSVVHPPSPVNLDPVLAESDKQRFLENLWTTQAMFRAKEGRSVVLVSGEKEVESRGGRVTQARTYFNVYQRTAYLTEPKKVRSSYRRSNIEY